MAEPVQIKVEFFRLFPPKTLANPYQAVCNALGKVSIPIIYDGVPLRVETFRKEESYVVGTASRTDLDNLPLKIKPSVPGINPLPLDNDEGIGRPTGFLVAQVNDAIVVALHKNYQGLKANGFTQLVQGLVNSPGGSFSMALLVQLEQLQKVMGWQVYRKFQLRIANPLSPDHYQSTPVMSAAKLTEDVDARTVSIELGMGHAKKGSLAAHKVRSAVIELLGLKKSKTNGDVETLVISGKTSEDAPLDKIDLLQQRLVREVTLPQTGRVIATDTLEKAMEQAFLAAHSELVAYFSQP